MNFNWQEVFNKFSDDLANAFDLFTGNLKLTKVFKATIIEKLNDTVYKVSYKNAEYKVKSYYDLIVGDIVWVCAPGGDWDSLFVQSYNGFLDRIVTTDKVVNNLTTNVAGTVLDGRMGKSLKDQLDQQNSNLNDVKNVYYSVGSGIDANSCSGGIIYLLKKNSLCQIRGSITIIAALNNDSSRSIFSPEFNGQAYSPIPDGMLLTYHVRYQDITGYLSYDATAKTFKLFNYSGKIISANSFIEIWGNYISNF